MTQVEHLAAWIGRAAYADLSEEACQSLKIRVLDALGCAIGAIDGPPMRMLCAQVEDFGGHPLVTLIGGGKTAPDLAALYNSALVRYLDYNDSYLARGETCHPSDTLGAVLAASEYAHASGKTFLTALAMAYQIQCRLSEVTPMHAKGFDHTTRGAFAVAAGVAKALGLSREQTANAIAISGTAHNALRVTRTGHLSLWKGLAYPDTAFAATHAAFLAMLGITGPLEIFEGNKGIIEAITEPFALDWQQEHLEIVRRTSIKRFNAEFYSQSALEGILELKEFYQVRPEEIERIEVEIFDVAYHIIGGGEEGDRHDVRTKEDADHSLPYLIAVVLLDEEVTPAQYTPERIVRDDVQTLLHKVNIRPDDTLSQRFPKEMPCRLRVFLSGCRILSLEKHDYAGFFTRPFTWEQAQTKFEHLTASSTEKDLCQEIVETIAHLEMIEIDELAGLLARVKRSTTI